MNDVDRGATIGARRRSCCSSRSPAPERPSATSDPTDDDAASASAGEEDTTEVAQGCARAALDLGLRRLDDDAVFQDAGELASFLTDACADQARVRRAVTTPP